MGRKPCKECPWVVKNNHNKSITNHSKRLNKQHNCHMIDKTKLGDLWIVSKPECQCVGNKTYMESVT